MAGSDLCVDERWLPAAVLIFVLCQIISLSVCVLIELECWLSADAASVSVHAFQVTFCYSTLANTPRAHFNGTRVQSFMTDERRLPVPFRPLSFLYNQSRWLSLSLKLFCCYCYVWMSVCLNVLTIPAFFRLLPNSSGSFFTLLFYWLWRIWVRPCVDERWLPVRLCPFSQY